MEQEKKRTIEKNSFDANSLRRYAKMEPIFNCSDTEKKTFNLIDDRRNKTFVVFFIYSDASNLVGLIRMSNS